MSPGQRFSPYSIWVGIFIPEWLVKWKALGWGAKAAYAQLVRMAGEGNESIEVDVLTVAEVIGIGEKQTREYLHQLVDAALLEVKRQGQGKPNIYWFIWHEEMLRGKTRRGPVQDRARRPGQQVARRPVPSTKGTEKIDVEDSAREDAAAAAPSEEPPSTASRLVDHGVGYQAAHPPAAPPDLTRQRRERAMAMLDAAQVLMPPGHLIGDVATLLGLAAERAGVELGLNTVRRIGEAAATAARENGHWAGIGYLRIETQKAVDAFLNSQRAG